MFFFFFFGPEACEILAVHPEMEHVPPPLRGKVSTTGPRQGNALTNIQAQRTAFLTIGS